MRKKLRPVAPRQHTLALDAPVLEGLAQEERVQAISLLAKLLLEASGMANEESEDEDL